MTYFIWATAMFFVGVFCFLIVYTGTERFAKNQNGVIVWADFRRELLTKIIIAILFFGLSGVLMFMFGEARSLGRPMDFDDLEKGEIYKVYELVELQEVVLLTKEDSEETLCVSVNLEDLSKFKEGGEVISLKGEPVFVK